MATGLWHGLCSCLASSAGDFAFGSVFEEFNTSLFLSLVNFVRL